MRVGLSMYSLWGAINSGRISALDAVQWIADQGGDHVEMVNFVVPLAGRDDLVDSIKNKAAACGLEISAYSASAALAGVSAAEHEQELLKAYKEIDIGHKLGVKIVRCDLYKGDFSKTRIEYFDEVFPQLVGGAQALSDYAKQYGITVTVENHGLLVNGGDRVSRLLSAVNRENYRATLDTGNSLCVDEDPAVCVKTLLPWAATVHIKDFYIRRDAAPPLGALAIGAAGDSPEKGVWLKTSHGRYLRGAIVGHGDMDIREIIALLREGGYSGYLTIEFEGMEDCEKACRIGMQNLKNIGAS